MMQKCYTISGSHDIAECSSLQNCDGCGDACNADTSISVDIREVVEQVQQGRQSVRDLASKFEKEHGAAAKIVTEVKWIDKVHLSSEAEFQQLRLILVDLRRRVAGRDKDDVERALSTAASLEVICAPVGSQLAQGRWEVKNLVLLFNQVANDAKDMLEGIRSVAFIEIEAAKETITNLQNVLQQQKKMWTATDGMELEELKREAHEARRIKILHESSKAMEMEHKINCLRQQLVEKAAEAVKLRKEVETIKERGQEGGKSLAYVLAGDEYLGSTLSIVPVNDIATDPCHCAVQWYHINDDRAKHLISGAIRPQYAPEPSDVGKILHADINLPGGKTQAVQTSGPITSARGLDKYVESLASKGGAQFNVRIVLKNGETVENQLLHTFDVNRTRIKLHKMHTVKAMEIYASSMQLCGARGGGDSAAQGLFWVAKKNKTFMLVLESERERNAAIMLARNFANLQNVRLREPGERNYGITSAHSFAFSLLHSRTNLAFARSLRQ